MHITLSVPAGWSDDTGLLAFNSPEDNRLILENGCRILMKSRDAAAGLNQADEKKRLAEEAERAIASAAAEYQKRIDALAETAVCKERANAEEKARLLKTAATEAALLKKQLEVARFEVETASAKAAALVQTAAAARAEGFAAAAKDADARLALLAASAADAKKAAEEAKKSKADAEKRLLEAQKDRVAEVRAERERASKELKEAAAAAAEERARASKALAEALAQKDVDAAAERERAAANARAATEAHAASLQTALTRQAGSSTKGADNEQALDAILIKSFGPTSGFKMLPKKLESGDRFFITEGFKIMAEAKNYSKTVPPAEVDKALRDMSTNPDCAALLFVSENSDISGHQKPGNTDICIIEGKPAAFIGNFAQVSDKVAHLQMVGSTLIAFCRLLVSSSASDADAITAKQHKIDDMLRHFRDSNSDMDGLLKSMKVFQRAHNVAWETFKGEITDKIERFKRRLAEIQMDEAAAAAGLSADTDQSADTDAAPPMSTYKASKAKKLRGPMTAEAKKAATAKRLATLAAKKAAADF
jgi:hypothetical protein